MRPAFEAATVAAMASTFESVLDWFGLLWQGERVHILTFDKVQAAGVASRFEQGLEAVGTRTVAVGELVELHVVLDTTHTVPQFPKLRFDVLEEDWLFFGGLDDAVVSLRTRPRAGEAQGAGEAEFQVVDRILSEVPLEPGQEITDAVNEYRQLHPEDYERGFLLLREPAGTPPPKTHVIGWWRAEQIEDVVEPAELYFLADVQGVRDACEQTLTVGPAPPGVTLRLHGHVLESEPANAWLAPGVRGATVTLAGRTEVSGPAGRFVFDLRLAAGSHDLDVARPGINGLQLSLDLSEDSAGSMTLVVRERRIGGAELLRRVIGKAPPPTEAVVVELDLRVLVHELHGTVTFPDSFDDDAAYGGTPVGRRVYALPLRPGATEAQRPRTTREWASLRSRRDVLRSRLPVRDGEFTIRFIDLTAGSSYLLWVEGPDPPDSVDPAETSPEYLVRTFHRTLRQMNGDHGNNLSRNGVHMIDANFGLKATPPSIGRGLEVIRIIDVDASPAAEDLRALRPSREDPAAIDSDPPSGEALALDSDTRRLTGLELKALPLVPVYESPDEQSPAARRATRGLLEQAEADWPRGVLLRNMRFVVEMPRLRFYGDTRQVLENTFFVHPELTSAEANDPAWDWWRCDAVALVDEAPMSTPAMGTYDARGLDGDWAPALWAPLPSLPGLFEGRRVFLGPGHGVFAEPPLGAAPANWLSARGGWNNLAGEDENNLFMARRLNGIARANGLRTVASRELDNLRLGGILQTGASAFAPGGGGDFPRLWAQNAYYYFAERVDPGLPAADRFVRGEPRGNNLASTEDPDPNLMRKNIDGNGARIAAVIYEADPARAQPIDAFFAIHTNGGGHGTEVLYLDIRPTAGSPAPGAGGYVEGNTLGLAFAQLVQAQLVARLGRRDRLVRTVTANGKSIGDLQSTYPHFRSGAGGAGALRALAANPAVPNPVPFPREIPVALAEVAFHDHADEGPLLATMWFRRRAGEAMAVAIEALLRSAARDVTREEVKALLTGVFGGTARVTGLAGGAGDAVADLDSDIEAVTGVAGALGGASLEDVVTEIERARNSYTRLELATALHNAVAEIAGYDTDDDEQAEEIARFVAGPIADGPLPDLARPARPPTRADAAGFAGRAIGVSRPTPPRSPHP